MSGPTPDSLANDVRDEDSRQKAVLIYREQLLHPSETFILSQARELKSFLPIFVCLKHLPGTLPTELPLVEILADSRYAPLRRLVFKTRGPSGTPLALLKARSPSLVHAHFGPGGSDALPIATSLGIPLVVSLHGFALRSRDPIDRLRFLRLRHKASLFLCVSDYIRDRAIARGVPPSRAITHYTGVDLTHFKPRRAVSREKVVLFVGRLVEAKGCHLLLRAMAASSAGQEVRVVVIGGGPWLSRLQREAAKLRVPASFLGFQSHSEVRRWMNSACLLCVPTLSEGFGMVFAEAQAMELPVVAFRNTALPEVVEDRKTGFLVPTGSVRDLARALDTLLESPEMRSTFGIAGRQRVEAKFNLSAQTRRLEALYQQTCAERRP